MNTYKYHSFDVFDTLVTRKVGNPKHIFMLTGELACEQVGLKLDPKIFVNERIKAATNLVKAKRKKNNNIHDIYDQLAKNIGISSEESKRILEIELETEYDNLIPLDKTISKVHQLRKQGSKIIYISDMYLTEGMIRKILENAGVYIEGEPIFVSCDHGAEKKTGMLFQKVMESLSIQKDELCHYGNSLSCDVRGAELAGISACHLPEGNLNRYEKYLSNVGESYRMTSTDILQYSRIAAASRFARVSYKDIRIEKKQIYTTASSVAAPVLLKFVIDILSQAEGKKIYFIARDGYILYRIAKLVNQAFNKKLDINYLYLSRESIILAMLDKPESLIYQKQLTKLFPKDTVRDLLARLKVSDQSISTSNLDSNILDELTVNVDDSELEKIYFSEHICKDIKEETRRRKTILIKYLEQEGMFENKEIALVDVGWNLTIHDMLSELLREQNAGPPEGYYYGVGKANSYLKNGKKYGYMYDTRKGEKGVSTGAAMMIEVFCSAPHGKTVDYVDTGKLIRPVFNNYEAKYLIEWGVKDLERAILNSIKMILRFGEKFNSVTWDIEILRGLIKLFWETPTRSEIDAWGKYPFYISTDGNSIEPLYKNMSYPKLFFHTLKRGGLPVGRFKYWPFAHIYSVNFPKRVLIKCIIRLNKMLGVACFAFII